MMTTEKHPLHLKNPELQTSPEVQRAVERKQARALERVPNDPASRIEAYTDRLEHIFLNPDERVRERNLEMLRGKMYDALIIEPEHFPESYFELQKRVAREQGHGDIQISEEMREQMIATVREDQRHSLDAWIDYLASDDAVYPAWFKYFVWKNIIKLSQFDKERGEFKKRTDTTVAPFPDIYREPLAQIADIYEKVKEDNKSLAEPEIREAFGKKFPTLYAELISQSLAVSLERHEGVRGQWVKYEQGDMSQAETLYTSLEGRGTGWCTAGRSTAQAQIKSGDFYVYYTDNEEGNPTQPRLAIRMNGNNRIGEVRGILPHQNVEPAMQAVLEEKLSEFGSEADAYRTKSESMRHLTALDQKKERNEPFTRDDLTFLYETDKSITGFGYERDPRIEELRNDRNTSEDMLVIFDCTRDQIAHVPSEIREGTKAYVGQLEPGIFDKLKHVEQVYTKFPEGHVKQFETTIGGQTKEQLIARLKGRATNIPDYAGDMLEKKDFTTSQKREQLNLVQLSVEALGFSRGASTQQIFKRAQELGLELCPAEVGPHLRLQYTDQPLDEWFYVAMKPIADRSGNPCVFSLDHRNGSLLLHRNWAEPKRGWRSDDRFVFVSRK